MTIYTQKGITITRRSPTCIEARDEDRVPPKSWCLVKQAGKWQGGSSGKRGALSRRMATYLEATEAMEAMEAIVRNLEEGALMSSLFEPTLTDMIACARREVWKRKHVYAGLVSKDRMTQEKADHEIECMEAIVRNLEKQSTSSS